MAGILYGVGVGPGDPELLTLKAIKAIEAADVIIAPKTEKKRESIALGIAKPYVKPETQIVRLVFPMVDDEADLSQAWRKNKETILSLLEQGKKVVFLTLGDPMVYSTYIYVYRLLSDCGYPIETIPGITSFCAIGSRLGRPVVEGDRVLSIIPATMEEEALERAVSIADNVVLMKVYKNYPQVVKLLARYGFLEDASLISQCGLPEEHIVPDIRALESETRLTYLSTIIAKR